MMKKVERKQNMVKTDIGVLVENFGFWSITTKLLGVGVGFIACMVTFFCNPNYPICIQEMTLLRRGSTRSRRS